MKVALTLLLLFAPHSCTTGVRGQSSDVVGSWKIKVTFKDGSERTLILTAEPAGKAFLTVGNHGQTWWSLLSRQLGSGSEALRTE